MPADVAKQRSLITVFTDEYRGDYREYVPLNFHHVTASVYFKEADGLMPGSIKSISIKNLYVSGTYDFRTDSWTDLRDKTSYTSELNKRVTGMDGEEITNYLTAFTVLPQQTSEDTSVEVIYTDDYTKQERILTGPLSCRFEPGKRYDIYISPQSIRCEYSFIMEGSQVPEEGSGAEPVYADMHIPKSDSELSYVYKRIRLGRTIIRKDMADEFEFINPETQCDLEYYKYNPATSRYDIPIKLNDTFIRYIDYTHLPEWTEGSLLFRVKKPKVADGAIDKALKEMPELGSEQRPYNLSNATGDTLVQNTANCYIVNAPGTYSIPLVYGNAIKDGRINERSLKTDWFSANSNYMITTNPIAGRLTNRTQSSASYVDIKVTTPYLVDYKSTTMTAANYIKSAKVQWQSPMGEGQADIISDVRLSDDRRSLTFKVNRSTIRQGNALISVFDSNNRYEIWSWHIWITDYVPGQNDKILVNRTGKKYTVMPRYLGWVDQREGNDEYVYRITVTVRGTKKRFEFYPRIKAELKMYGECPLYQWGRPMPFMNPLTSPISYSVYKSTLNKPLIFSVCSPMVVFNTTQSRSFSNYINTWNWINNNLISSSNSEELKAATNWNTGETVKTIYDPCPAGYCMPMGDTFSGLFSHTGNSAAFNNDYQINDSQYSNALEIYCNPFERNPDNTYVFPTVSRVELISSNFTNMLGLGLWTSSVERYYSSSSSNFALGHAYYSNTGYTPYATPTAALNQVIPMREP